MCSNLQIGRWPDRFFLNSIHHTVEADHRSGNREGCLRGTRRDVFLQLEDWLEDKQGQNVFWLNGIAGTGKSTIAQTFAEICFADGNLGASFFCSRESDDRSNIQLIFPTLAFQLAHSYPRFREGLLKLLWTNPDVGQESPCSQMEKLIVGPLKETQIQTLIIIDALDKCEDQGTRSAILSALSEHVDQIPNVKFFITGRPANVVLSGFRLPSLHPVTRMFRLNGVERSLVDNDIKLFLRTRLTGIAKDYNIQKDWPSLHDIYILCWNARQLFSYASTFIKFVSSQHYHPTKRLAVITTLPQNATLKRMSETELLQVLEKAFIMGLFAGGTYGKSNSQDAGTGWYRYGSEIRKNGMGN